MSLIIASIVTLSRRIVRGKGEIRQHAAFLLAGVIITNLGGFITNFILVNVFGLTSLIPLPPYLSLGFSAVMVYAILTQHLFDIRVLIRRTVIFSSLVAFAFVTYSLVLYVTAIFLGPRNTGASITDPNLYINFITIIIVGFSYEPIKKWLSERTDRWLFKREYEQQEVVKELGQKLNRVIALDEAMETVMQTVAHVFHVDKAVTYVFQPSERGETAIKRIKQIGYETADRLILDEKDFVVQYMIDHGEVLDFEQLTLEIEREKALLDRSRKPEEHKTQADFIRAHAIKTAVHKKLKQLGTSIAIPLKLDRQLIGLIMASEKQSGERYSDQDLKLMGLVGDQAISSIQKAKLYEGDLMKTEFVSIASHELLTPVSAIEGYLSMILEEKIAGAELSDQTRTYLEKCFSSSKRLSMLIKDLLSVSRIESGKMKFEPQQLDIMKSITDTVEQLKIVGNEKDVKILVEPPEGKLPAAWIDPDRFSQVLVNLISNAIKYNKLSGEVTISITEKKRDHILIVSVKDTGIGMSADAMRHLFEKFYRVDNPSTVGIVGTGLGLYITKSIVERMGGAITVQSKEGKGTTFSFTVPILRAERSMLV
jgi:signal transduction histidine kinase